MTAPEIIATHLREARFYLDSLTREERKPDRKYVMEICAVRRLKRIRASLMLASVRIEAQARETSRVLGLLDARAATLAREGVLR